MAITVDASGAIVELLPAITKTSSPPILSTIQRMASDVYYWGLSRYYSSHYPDIMAGADIASMPTADEVVQFFTDWYSSQNGPLIISHLKAFDPNGLEPINPPNRWMVSEDDQNVWNGLMYGTQRITNSDLSLALKTVSSSINQETQAGYQHTDYHLIYRIGFLLTLPPVQSHMYLCHLMGEFERAIQQSEISDNNTLDTLRRLIDRTRRELIRCLQQFQEA